ncbi:MFS transporter [Mobilicoccus caccae]|uniref:MFS transporter n=1 Tax=Mobilicoccus caccae TaxID=1859295 RepID=A0ABQ6IJF8_9MICO|nr:MFS transporter [Mobilicoccus caccae]
MSAFLSTLAVFAVGFVARPLGGLMFGRVSDRLGRKRALAMTVALGSFASLIIAVAPPYVMVGVLAYVVLFVARVLQGLAHGGEQPAAQAYLAEAAPPERRGLWSTLIYFSGTIGANFGLVLATILSAVLGQADMSTWGWRIAFAIGAVGGLFALYMRSRMSETEEFERTEAVIARERPSLVREMWVHRRSAFQVIGMTVGLTVSYYLWVVAAAGYSIAVLKADPTATLIASVAANTLFLVWLPLWGILSDRIGRKPVMLIGIVGLFALCLPLSAMIDGDPVRLFLAMTIAQVFVAAPCAISPAIMCEIFPTRIRTIGVALPLSIAIAIFGGTSLYLQTYLTRAYGPQAFSYYVMALLLVSAITVLTLPETRGRVLNDETA